jgi:hypothetical protein
MTHSLINLANITVTNYSYYLNTLGTFEKIVSLRGYEDGRKYGLQPISTDAPSGCFYNLNNNPIENKYSEPSLINAYNEGYFIGAKVNHCGQNLG